MRTSSRITFIAIMAASLGAFSQQSSSEPFSLETFLAQFRSSNELYKSIDQKIRAAELNDSKADLLTPTDFFASANFTRDEKLPSIPFFNYGSLNTFASAVGIQNTAPFGLKTKLAYEIDHFTYNNLLLDPSIGSQNISLYDARPVLSVEQPLWKNGFGKKTKLLIRQTSKLTSSEKLNLESEKENMEIQAEQIYQQLAAAREFLKIQQLALEQTKNIHEYVKRRVAMNLSDSSDLLQAQAQLELEMLEIDSVSTNISILEKNFNLFRGAEVSQPIPPLQNLEENVDPTSIQKLHGVSLLYLTSKNKTEVDQIQSDLSYDDTLPSLNLQSSFALNGRDQRFGSVIGDSFGSDRSTFNIGLMLTVPLDIRTNANLRKAAKLNVKASEQSQTHIHRQDITNREVLFQKAMDAAQRLSLSKTIAETQKKKLDLEKTRLRQGRTTTYQVLLFERDLLLSDSRAVQAKLDWALLKSELKKYSHSEKGE